MLYGDNSITRFLHRLFGKKGEMELLVPPYIPPERCKIIAQYYIKIKKRIKINKKHAKMKKLSRTEF